MRTNPLGSAKGGFTLIELLTVITIIMILVGMIIGIASLVQQKQARAAAEAQIQAMSTAIESYKVDNAIVPRTSVTDALNSKTSYAPTAYATASRDLYKALSGDVDVDASRTKDSTEKSYFNFKPAMLAPSGGTGAVTAINDPFGYSYGYSTAANLQIENGATVTNGYNPTFDLWSTGGAKDNTSGNVGKWIKNW